MSIVKKLAGQTAIYGLSSIVGRLLNYFLVPLYTRVLLPQEYGSVIEFYAYIAIILVFLTYGLETAFFRYSESETDKEKVYSTSLISIGASSIIFLLLSLSFIHPISSLINYPNQSRFVFYIALLLAFDALATIPFARLRAQNKAKLFVVYKVVGIGLNIGLNLLFLLGIPALTKISSLPFLSNLSVNTSTIDFLGVDFILLSNVASSVFMFVVFIPSLLKLKWIFDFDLWKKIMLYALPILIFSLAGVVNEVFDRVLLKYLLPSNIAMAQLGIYGACYKVAILMTIFIQAYRYAAEPFFFAYEKQSDSKQMYAKLMHYFVIITSFIFLGTMLYIDLIIHFVGEKYRDGANVIPILLMANLFLGVYYNLSIWYKLTNKTKYGAYISMIGAIITLLLNFIWIPLIGYMGSAWATLLCYGSMMVISYFMGKKHYPIPYQAIKAILIIVLATIVYFISAYWRFDSLLMQLLFNSFLLIIYSGIILYSEKNLINSLLIKVKNKQK